MKMKSVDPGSETSENVSRVELKAQDIIEKMEVAKAAVDDMKLQAEKALAEAQSEKVRVATELAAFIDEKKADLASIRKGYDSVVAGATANQLSAKYAEKAKDEKDRPFT